MMSDTSFSVQIGYLYTSLEEMPVEFLCLFFFKCSFLFINLAVSDLSWGMVNL